MPIFHVRYVVNETAGPDTSTSDVFASALGNPLGLSMLLAIIVGLAIFALAAARFPGWSAFRSALDGTLGGYVPHLPWILRLSAGIALMGSGLANYLFVPHFDLPGRGFFSILLLACGFAIMVGIAVRAAALLALIVWSWALVTRGWDALMAAEAVGALIALTVLSAGKPSLDHIMAKTLPRAPGYVRPLGGLRFLFGPEAERTVSALLTGWVAVLLRVGLGVSLAYAGLAEKWLDPGPALATVDKYGLAVGLVTPEMWVVAAGLIEILLGVALVIGLAARPFATLAFVVLTLTLFALPDDPVVAHVPLWGVASAVFILGAGPKSVDAALRAAGRPHVN